MSAADLKTEKIKWISLWSTGKHFHNKKPLSQQGRIRRGQKFISIESIWKRRTIASSLFTQGSERKKIVWQTKSSLNRVAKMCCKVSSRMCMLYIAYHPIITATSRTSPLHTLLQWLQSLGTSEGSNFWYAVTASYSWTQLESIKNDYNTQTLARLQKNRQMDIVLYVASLAAFHLSKTSPQVNSH